jgi:hypothetical protein
MKGHKGVSKKMRRVKINQQECGAQIKIRWVKITKGK